MDFLTVLDSFVTVLDYEINYYRELSNYQIAPRPPGTPGERPVDELKERKTMIVLSRTKLFLLAVAALALGAAIGLGIAYRQEIRAWAGGQNNTAAVDSSGHDLSQPEMAGMDLPSQRKVLYWYDPMHPAYTSDQPGIAPDCGMNLVPKYADEVEAMQDRPPGTVMLSAGETATHRSPHHRSSSRALAANYPHSRARGSG